MRFIWTTKLNKNQDFYTSCSERFGPYLKEVQMASTKIECEQRHETLPSGIPLRTFKFFLSSPSKVHSSCFERCCCFLNLPLQFIHAGEGSHWAVPKGSCSSSLGEGSRAQCTGWAYFEIALSAALPLAPHSLTGSQGLYLASKERAAR